MISGPHSQTRTSISLPDNCVYLARDGSMRPYAKTAEFFRNAGKNPALRNGLVLTLHEVNTPQDVHYPAWEMHPEGDELLICAFGSLAVEFRNEGIERTAPLPLRSAFIVPVGVWHRLIVHEPSVLIAITPGHNTVHESG